MLSKRVIDRLIADRQFGSFPADATGMQRGQCTVEDAARQQSPLNRIRRTTAVYKSFDGFQQVGKVRIFGLSSFIEHTDGKRLSADSECCAGAGGTRQHKLGTAKPVAILVKKQDGIGILPHV